MAGKRLSKAMKQLLNDRFISGVHKGWTEAERLYQSKLNALQAKLDAIEAEQRAEEEALVNWSESKMN